MKKGIDYSWPQITYINKKSPDTFSYLMINLLYKNYYFIISCSANIFFKAITPFSTCSFVCVAIRAKRTSVS